jgi:trk system potassium uptake protein TrkA
MFVIIAGCGRLGAGLARALSAKGHDVVVVGEEIDLTRLGSDFDGVTIRGDPAEQDVLIKAGVERAELVVAATADDNVNVLVVQVARKIYQVPLTLARISDPERERFYRDLGLATVCPTTTGINQMLGMIQHSQYSALAGTIDVDLVGVKPLAEWVGRAAGRIDLPEGRKLIGIAFDGQLAAVNPERVIEKNDTLILTRKRAS